MYTTTSHLESLRSFTQDPEIIEELSRYTENKFALHVGGYNFFEEKKEDSQIQTWNKYMAESKGIGVYETLRKYLAPFQFPIQKGISQDPLYKAVTLKGQMGNPSSGIPLNEPNSLELFLHEGVAGKIPVLVVPDAQDFQRIIQALGYKNEPVALPDSMGASMINGLNNWDRIQRLKEEWTNSTPLGNWQTYFRQHILPHKALYQDRLIVLSKKPYSGVSARVLGLEEEEWQSLSLQIRLAHECAHYFTLKHLGGMYINLHDELLADYMGITRALGYFNSHWFSHFMGLEGEGYREGGRMENYLGKPPLSSGAFMVLQEIVRLASKNLELFSKEVVEGNTPQGRKAQLLTLATCSLPQLTRSNAVENMLNRMKVMPWSLKT